MFLYKKFRSGLIKMPKFFIVLFILIFTNACSDKPSRARFPGPPGRTTEFAQAQSTQEVLGGFDPTAKQELEEKAIRGIIKIKEGLKIPQKNYMIFISARSLSGEGPPLAVLRLGPRKIPFRFALTQANVMLQGTELDGFVEVTARVIQEGSEGQYDPLSRQPGDLFGSKRVKVGAKDVEIIIDTQIE
jgi:hypothetical protein